MENISEITNKKLELIGEDPSKIKPFMMDHLKNIEEYLTAIEAKYNDALDILKLKDCSVSNVAKQFNMSRTTLYNHNSLLKRYIEATEALLLENSPIHQVEKLKTEITDSKNQIDMLYDRDITLEVQKHEIHELSNRLKEKNKEIKRLETRNRELSSEVMALKRENKTATNVTTINRKK